MGEQATLVAAFAAGLLSFISPYVLPVIPGYLSYISGLSLDEMRGTGPSAGAAGVAIMTPSEARRRALTCSIAFCLGFSIVFVTLGASASAIGSVLRERLTLIGQIAGVIVILFGLHAMGVLRIGWLSSRKRVQTKRKPAGLAGAGLVGIAFALGWTPCLGPIVAGVLAIAATQGTIGHGVRLLASYSLGLAVPFILTAVAINQFLAASTRIRRHFHTIEIASGALLVVLGALIFTNRLTLVPR
jgi:cytochrome c-type biogenesis protein